MKGMFFIVMLVISPCLLAQDCYQAFLERGIEAYGQYKFQQSIDLFNAAKICPDNDADKLYQ